MGKPKIAPGSLLTADDQIRLYEEQKGRDATERQVRLARLERKQCICAPRSVKRHWEGAEKLTNRSVHDVGCPKFKRWMEEV